MAIFPASCLCIRTSRPPGIWITWPRLDGRPVSRSYLDELLKRFDVSDVDLTRRLRDQSHGMKQKIGIIQALMGRAPVLILDEPTAGLDPMMVQAFRETLEGLKKAGPPRSSCPRTC